jgi:hypothetical protein
VTSFGKTGGGLWRKPVADDTSSSDSPLWVLFASSESEVAKRRIRGPKEKAKRRHGDASGIIFRLKTAFKGYFLY